MPPRKREPGEITTLEVPGFSEEQWRSYYEGVALFNSGRHWHAHEAWEAAWLPMGNDPRDDAEIFLRALIQLASGMHLKQRGRRKGARSQLWKAKEKFDVCPTFFMGIDCASLRVFAEHQLDRYGDELICLLRSHDNGHISDASQSV